MASTSYLGKEGKDVPQMSDTIPVFTRYVTGFNAEGKSVIKTKDTARWKQISDGLRSHNVIYSNDNMADLNDDADYKMHEALLDSGTMGLVKPRGTLMRLVDFAPGYPGRLHITKSLDFGIVLEGTVDMTMDSGELVALKRGDIVVQRGTMHRWSNSGEGFARMVFILQDIDDLLLNGQKVNEAMAGKDFATHRSVN